MEIEVMLRNNAKILTQRIHVTGLSFNFFYLGKILLTIQRCGIDLTNTFRPLGT